MEEYPGGTCSHHDRHLPSLGSPRLESLVYPSHCLGGYLFQQAGPEHFGTGTEASGDCLVLYLSLPRKHDRHGKGSKRPGVMGQLSKGVVHEDIAYLVVEGYDDFLGPAVLRGDLPFEFFQVGDEHGSLGEPPVVVHRIAVRTSSAAGEVALEGLPAAAGTLHRGHGDSAAGGNLRRGPDCLGHCPCVRAFRICVAGLVSLQDPDPDSMVDVESSCRHAPVPKKQVAVGSAFKEKVAVAAATGYPFG